MKPNKDEEDAVFARIEKDGSEVKASGNRGCGWAILIWLALLALGCAGWVLAQAWNAWTA